MEDDNNIEGQPSQKRVKLPPEKVQLLSLIIIIIIMIIKSIISRSRGLWNSHPQPSH